MAWVSGGWRRESGTAAQRAMLILHIEEVEAVLSGFRDQSSMANRATRYDMEQYLARLQTYLEDLDEDIADAADGDHPFVQAKPLLNDTMEIE